MTITRLKTNPRNDGRDLEKAVQLIQECILRRDPQLKGTYTVDLNKRLVVAGTRYEVDVYVVINPETPYASVFVFECKDLKKAVSAAQLMSFKEKVDRLGATRGILVARRISPDAEALLATYPRIEYRECSDDIRAMLGIDVIHTIHEPVQLSTTVFARRADVTFPADFAYAVCRWGSRLSLFQTFVKERLSKIVATDQLYGGQNYSSESVHWLEVNDHWEFAPAEFMLLDIDLHAIDTRARFFVKVSRTQPRYRCSIKGDGHVQLFEIKDEDFPLAKLELQVVCTDTDK